MKKRIVTLVLVAVAVGAILLPIVYGNNVVKLTTSESGRYNIYETWNKKEFLRQLEFTEKIGEVVDISVTHYYGKDHYILIYKDTFTDFEDGD